MISSYWRWIASVCIRTGPFAGVFLPHWFGARTALVVRGPVLPAEKQVVQQDGQFVKRQEDEERGPFPIFLVEVRHVGGARVNPVAPDLELVADHDHEPVDP